MSAISLQGLAVFRHRDFALIWTATFLSSVAMAMMAVAIGWQIYDLTGSAFDLGLVGLAEFLPSVLLVLVTGAAADRFDRRLVTIAALTAELLCALTLAYLTWHLLADRLSILAIAAGFGVARAFAAPAARALLPVLVPVAELPSAIAWSSISWQAAVVGGPAIGGFLYAWHGADSVYATAAALLLLSAAGLAAIRRPPRAASRTDEPIARQIVAGLRLIFRRKILLGVISLDLFAVMFSGAIALLPIFAKDVLQTGPDGLGMLRAAPGIGATLVAIYLTQFPLKRAVGRWLFAGVGAFGLAAIAFSVSRDFYLSCALLAIMGAGDMMSVYIRGTIVPLATPDWLRGRVMAVEMVFIGASNELGAFCAGVLASILGAVAAVTFGGTATVLIVLAWMRLFPEIVRIERLEPGEVGYREEDEPDRVAAAQAAPRDTARDGG